jgi:hypothetical protein
MALFVSAFGHTMPASLWHWKYDDQCKPGILAHAAGKAVAHYGGLPRVVWLRGVQHDAVQIGDVMVDPDMRGILTRRGPFMRSAFTFLQDKTGLGKPFRLAFGFPSGRHAKLGEKLGLYGLVDDLFEAIWPASPGARLPFWLKIRPVSADDHAMVDALWERMRADLVGYAAPQKDADFFKHRYMNHPTQTYLLFLVSLRWRSRPEGILVLRDHGQETGVELMDMLGPLDKLGRLFKAALALAGGLGRQRLFGWMTSGVLAALPGAMTRTKITDICIATPDLEEMTGHLRSCWWLMSGDTDSR